MTTALVVMLGSTVLAQNATAPTKPAATANAQEIERLVKQLDSSRFKEREAATKRLTEIGEQALDALGKAKDTLEMRRRAEAIIGAIEDKLYREYCLIGQKRDPKPDGSDRNR